MPKNKYSKCNCYSNINNYCNNLSNQLNFLATIYTSIISEEIEDDEVLGLLGSFLVVLGEQIGFASETRIFCKSQFEEGDSEENIEEDTNIQSEDIFDFNRCKSKTSSRRNYKKIRRKVKKRKMPKK